MGGRLIFYDTSNYIDFPVGGQLTSVRNFLRFLKESLRRLKLPMNYILKIMVMFRTISVNLNLLALS